MTTTMSRAMERSIRNLDAAERNLYVAHKIRSDRRRIKKNTRRLSSARRKLHNLVGTVAGQGVDPLQLPLSPEHHLIVSEVWFQYRRIVEFHLDGETHRFMRLARAKRYAAATEAARRLNIHPALLPPVFDATQDLATMRREYEREGARAERAGLDPWGMH